MRLSPRGTPVEYAEVIYLVGRKHARGPVCREGLP